MLDVEDANMLLPVLYIIIVVQLAGIEFLSDDPVTKVGSWVHAPVTKYLVEEMGYEKGKNLDGAPYEYVLSFSCAQPCCWHFHFHFTQAHIGFGWWQLAFASESDRTTRWILDVDHATSRRNV